MDFFVGIICLIVGLLFVKYRAPIGKAGDAFDAKVESLFVPRPLRFVRYLPSGSERILIFGLLLISAGSYALYKGLFGK